MSRQIQNVSLQLPYNRTLLIDPSIVGTPMMRGAAPLSLTAAPLTTVVNVNNINRPVTKVDQATSDSIATWIWNYTHKILLTNSLQGCREAETRWCHHLYHSFFFSLTVHFPFYIPLIYILNIKGRLREEKKTQNINVGALMCALKSEQFVFIS